MAWFNESGTVTSAYVLGQKIRHNIPIVHNLTKPRCCSNPVSYLNKALAETRCNKHKPKDVILLLILINP